MRNTPIILTVVALTSVILCSCGKRDNAGALPRVALHEGYRPAQYVIAFSEQIKQDMIGPGLNQVTEVSSLVVSELEVHHPDEKRLKTASLGFKRFKLEHDDIKIDTNDPPPLSDNRNIGRYKETAGLSQQMELDKILREFLKSEISIRFGSDDSIEDLKGLEDIWTRIEEECPRSSQLLSQIRESFGDKMDKELILILSDMLPEYPVGVGAVWHTKIVRNIPFIGDTDCEMECELTELKDTPEGRVAVINFSSELANISSGSQRMHGAAVTITGAKLSQNGEVHLSVDSGLVKSHTARLEGDFRLNLRVEDGDIVSATSKVEHSLKRTVEQR